jgi:VIT1/CCC1 family predicted Fe2+/Mn2+ transporter
MAPSPIRTTKFLGPIDRVSELLFGLIMVLTFTGSLSIAEAGREDIRAMLVGALGCNLAWGIIDAILYLMGALADESRSLLTIRALRASRDADVGRRLVTAALPPLVASVLQPDEIESLRQRLTRLPAPAARVPLYRDMWVGSLGVFLWVFLGTLPVAVPFMFMRDAQLALRVSNGVAIVLLFAAGWVFGRITGRQPWAMGAGMVAIGVLLSGLTMALGG